MRSRLFLAVVATGIIVASLATSAAASALDRQALADAREARAAAFADYRSDVAKLQGDYKTNNSLARGVCHGMAPIEANLTMNESALLPRARCLENNQNLVFEEQFAARQAAMDRLSARLDEVNAQLMGRLG